MPLSGKDILKMFKKQGWEKLRQSGSHVIVGKGILRESIPMHKEIKKGLENKLVKTLKDKL